MSCKTRSDVSLLRIEFIIIYKSGFEKLFYDFDSVFNDAQSEEIQVLLRGASVEFAADDDLNRP